MSEPSPFDAALQGLRRLYPGDDLRISWVEPEQSKHGSLHEAKVELSVEMKVEGKWYCVDKHGLCRGGSAYKAVETAKFLALRKALNEIHTESGCDLAI